MTATVSPETAGPRHARPEPARRPHLRRRRPAAALTILVALAGVFVFLAVEGWPGLTADAGDLRAVHVVRQLHLAAGLRHAARRRRSPLVVAVPVRDRGRAVHLALRAAPARRRRSAT